MTQLETQMTMLQQNHNLVIRTVASVRFRMTETETAQPCCREQERQQSIEYLLITRVCP